MLTLLYKAVFCLLWPVMYLLQAPVAGIAVYKILGKNPDPREIAIMSTSLASALTIIFLMSASTWIARLLRRKP